MISWRIRSARWSGARRRSRYRCWRRISSRVSISSAISNGGVSALLKIVASATQTSMAPVSILSFTLPSRLDHDAPDADDPLGPGPLGGGVRVDEVLLLRLQAMLLDRLEVAAIEDDLRHARAVAEVDEDAAAVIAAPRDPAEQHDFLADVRLAQIAAAVRPLELIDETGHETTSDFPWKGRL